MVSPGLRLPPLRLKVGSTEMERQRHDEPERPFRMRVATAECDWAEFWARSSERCLCDDERCGLSLNQCPDCNGPLTVRILSHAPAVQVVCRPCDMLIEQLTLKAGGS